MTCLLVVISFKTDLGGCDLLFISIVVCVRICSVEGESDGDDGGWKQRCGQRRHRPNPTESLVRVYDYLQ